MKILQWLMTIPEEKQEAFNVKKNPDAWRLSRMYENEFGTKDIELRVLKTTA